MEWFKEVFNGLKQVLIWWIIINPWEQGIRSRAGKKSIILEPGIHFRIPFFDTIYVQGVRQRTSNMPPQTISTKDGKVITMAFSLGYKIVNIEKVYNSVYDPDSTIVSMSSGFASEVVYNNYFKDLNNEMISRGVINEFEKLDLGIEVVGLFVSTFAEVKTFRLIQDSHWIPEGTHYEEKR